MDAFEKWAEMIRPDLLKHRLLKASMFLCGFQMLEEILIQRLLEFYSDKWNVENGWWMSQAYCKKVLNLDPKGKNDKLRSTIEWLFNNGALSKDDLALFIRLKDARNAYAHELHHVVSRGESPDFLTLFPEMRGLLLRVERWWIVNVELETGGLPDGVQMADVDLDGIMPGSVLMLDLLFHTALGDEEEAWRFYRRFCEEAGLGGKPEQGGS